VSGRDHFVDQTSRVRDSRSYFSTVSGDTDSAGTETTSAVPSFVSARELLSFVIFIGLRSRSFRHGRGGRSHESAGGARRRGRCGGELDGSGSIAPRGSARRVRRASPCLSGSR